LVLAFEAHDLHLQRHLELGPEFVGLLLRANPQQVGPVQGGAQRRHLVLLPLAGGVGGGQRGGQAAGVAAEGRVLQPQESVLQLQPLELGQRVRNLRLALDSAPLQLCTKTQKNAVFKLYFFAFAIN